MLLGSDEIIKFFSLFVHFIKKNISTSIFVQLTISLTWLRHTQEKVKTLRPLEKFHLNFINAVHIFCTDDLSYNKVATQLNTYNDQNHDAKYAVDKNTSTCMRTEDIGLSSLYKTMWWKVDLGGVYNIYSINILFKNNDALSI